MVRSLISTLPSPTKSPVDQVCPSAEVAQHDGQVVDVDFAVAIGVPGQEGSFQINGGHVHPHLVGVDDQSKPKSTLNCAVCAM